MNHKYSEEEREFIRVHYKQTHASRQGIATRLGVTEYGVAGQIARMGLCKRTDRHPWTPKEDEKLKGLIPHYGVIHIARVMHRSINSVVVRSKRLGIHRRNHEGWYTKKEVCEILGVDHHWIQHRIDSGELKATYHNGHRPTSKGMAMWHIEERDLKAFIRRYPCEFNGRNVDLMQIVEILVGIQA